MTRSRRYLISHLFLQEMFEGQTGDLRQGQTQHLPVKVATRPGGQEVQLNGVQEL